MKIKTALAVILGGLFATSVANANEPAKLVVKVQQLDVHTATKMWVRLKLPSLLTA